MDGEGKDKLPQSAQSAEQPQKTASADRPAFYDVKANLVHKRRVGRTIARHR